MLARCFALIVLALSVGGCVSTVDGVGIFVEDLMSDPAKVAAATEVFPDQHTGTTQISGPTVVFSNGLDFHEYRLRAWADARDPRSRDKLAILVRGEFDRRVYLADAYSRGEKQPTKKVDAERVCNGGCVTFETIAVHMDEAALRQYATEG